MTADERLTQGVVLAGGLSSRMGTDKALLNFMGEPLVARALGILRRAGLQGFIAGSQSPLQDVARVVKDNGNGPLGGICAGLAAAACELIVVLPVDLPLMPAELVNYMVWHAQITGAIVTLVSVSGFTQTFPAIVRRSALPALEAALEEGNRSCFAAFQRAAAEIAEIRTILPVEFLVQSGQISHEDGLPASFWFLNVNHPADLIRAQDVLEAHRRVC